MPLSALRPGDPQQLGDYEILGRLGAGGQGVVYLGQTAAGGGETSAGEGQTSAGERVAIKVLHYDVDEAFLLRELAMMRQVASFCTARVLDAQVTGNTWYIVSEYIDGRSLVDAVESDGPLAGGSLERLAVGTATALTAIHRTGVVHRDFKPANILLGPDGPRVIDFGIARALDATSTSTLGIVRGTPSYMAPEQINGQSAGTPADMFAWAATMAYAASGQSPFGSDTLAAIIMRILHDQPELKELTGTLHEVAVACLAKDPADRPTAQEVLIRLLGHTPVPPLGHTPLPALGHTPVPPLGHAPVPPLQALSDGTALAANIGLPPSRTSLRSPVQPPAQAPAPAPQSPAPQASAPQASVLQASVLQASVLQASVLQASAPQPSAHQLPAQQPPGSAPPPGFSPSGYSPPAAWSGAAPPKPPRRSTSTLTRVLAPIAAVVIVAIGVIVGLALTGAFSSAHTGAAPPATPAGNTNLAQPIHKQPRVPRHRHTQPSPAKPSQTQPRPSPTQFSPTPIPSSSSPVQTPPAPINSGGPVSTIPANLGGEWSGTGHQPGDTQTPTYTIVMSLSGGGTTGSTFYSSLKCQGTLTLLPGSTRKSVQLREQITSGGCTTTGVFTMHLRNGKLVFSYVPGDTTDPASYGTLHS